MQRRARSTPLKVADLSMSAAQIHFIGWMNTYNFYT
jgi:hypothetical protein